MPEGLSREQWEKVKADDLKKNAGNLGRSGPRGFQSRSMQSFQQDLEKGKVGHLMPIFNAKEKLAKGQIKPEDIPVRLNFFTDLSLKKNHFIYLK